MRLTERIAVVIDVVADKASTSLRQFGQQVDDTGAKARGLRGRIGEIGSTLRANLIPSLTAGAAAIGAFAMKAMAEFANAALAARDFAVKAGMATEEASRWVDVTGDLGAEANAVAAAIARLNRAAAAGKLEELGIDAANSTDRLIAALEAIAGIADETERAALAQELFGRGWQGLAPLIANVAQLRERLASTPDAQIFDDKDVETAQRYKDAMDSLGDTWRDLMLNIAPPLIEVLAAIADAIDTIRSAVESLPEPPDWLKWLAGQDLISQVRDVWRSVTTGERPWRQQDDDSGRVGSGMGSRPVQQNTTIYMPHSVTPDAVADAILRRQRAMGSPGRSVR